jgi:hypothetical protein
MATESETVEVGHLPGASEPSAQALHDEAQAGSGLLGLPMILPEVHDLRLLRDVPVQGSLSRITRSPTSITNRLMSWSIPTN